MDKIGENFRFKDRQLLRMRSGIVYQRTCSCGSTYIGQTKRNLLSIIKQHATSEKSEVCKRTDFNTSTILGGKNDSARLLIVQSLFIQELIPDLDKCSQCSSLMIFNT